MILVSIICLAAIVWLFDFFDKKQFKQTLFCYACILCVFFGLLLIPIYKGHSFINMVYSFFDVPSYLCVIWSIFFMAKIVIYDFFKIQTIHQINIRSTSIILLFISGLIYFMSALGLLWFNAYYVNVLSQAIITLILCLIIFASDKTLFFMIILSLTPFAFFNDANLSVLEFIICPYLWLFCGAKSINLAILWSIKNYKNRFCTNRI